MVTPKKVEDKAKEGEEPPANLIPAPEDPPTEAEVEAALMFPKENYEAALPMVGEGDMPHLLLNDLKYAEYLQQPEDPAIHRLL